MKKFYLLMLAFAGVSIANAQIINFPSGQLKARLLDASATNTRAKNLDGAYFAIDANNDSQIQVSEALQVSELYFYNNGISNITGLEYFTNLKVLSMPYNPITTLDATVFPLLTKLNVNHCLLTSLNASGLSALTDLDCTYNSLTSLNIDGTYALHDFKCRNNQIYGVLDLSGRANLLPELDLTVNHFTQLILTGCNTLTLINATENYLSETTDFSAVPNLRELWVSFSSIQNLDLSANPLIERVYANQCYGLSSMNVTGCVNLRELYFVTASYPTQLDLNPAVNLEKLTLKMSSPGTVAFNNCHILKELSLETDWLAVDLSLPALETLTLTMLNCTSLDLTALASLKTLQSRTESVTAYDFSGNALLEDVVLSYIYPTQSLDFSSNTHLQQVYLSGCSGVEMLNLKNGANEILNFNFNAATAIPNLKYLCTDDEQIESLDYLTQALPLCSINSYCSFTPGGTYYTVEGSSRADLDGNGCDVSDPLYPGIKFTVTDGVNSGTFVADALGSYSLPLQAGSHTITPVVENSYFTTDPSQFTISFPGDLNSVMQDICIIPNGIHNDLEILIMPIGIARPGFDATYNLLFRNTGNTTIDTDLDFAFDDSVMDFVQSVPPLSDQNEGMLHWSGLPIAPFETRSVLVKMNMNSPVETPALNLDDHLVFTAALTYSGTDETPLNNTTILRQTVVNSFDPNDKTCLEGDTITPGMVGDYVHYLIRFENTGTFAAENVVVKDIIDPATFDIASLVPVSSNYEFTTRITDGDKVEFIFENINLPFDDTNNDGYVLFKIRTKPTLTVGSTLSNKASIYFDYNLPIVTNTAVTAVALPLNTNENDNAFGLALYPNPVKDVLNISSKTDAVINVVQIYNALGQDVMKVLPANGDCSIDVSRLPVGSYVVKVISETGSWASRFIKE
ncbi:T9SS C-terminal target domain-containing protein [Flavobacterium magnum]|uniref:T9SS C-terminal target domain-containing protein n=1 Tax=Flavobacterium magnum TaxID=2162713 RepID=A0A2S0RG99_9FLAO|nr:T9SS type A sorting domain-containing protein [Flavobacterium magnum]AWA30559.1 T9SS C-terminal target domain-containing protein [Flavobacterium magnum]